MSSFSPAERLIAWRYLRARRANGFLSVITAFSILGIALGVATLILVTSLMNGIRHDMVQRFIGVDGHINIYGAEAPIEEYADLAKQLEADEAITYAMPRVEGQVMASHNGQAVGAQAVGLAPRDWQRKRLISQHMTSGRITDVARGGVIIGEGLAAKLRLKVGDELVLISPEGRATFAGLVPRMKSYPVIGTFKLGMHYFDSSLILMPLDAAQTYFKFREGKQTRVPLIELQLADMDKAEAIAGQLQQKLGADYLVYDWKRNNVSTFQALLVQRNVMVVILALIVLVAAFNIITGLIMLVKDKTRDIAVLRTLGASQASITRIFVLSGITIGTIGTLLGLGLGLWLSKHIEDIKAGIEKLTGQEILVENIYFLSTLPTRTDPKEVVAIVVFTLLLAFLAALYPAKRAARIDPVEALRYG